MLEMAKESYKNYQKALKKFMYYYAQGKDTELYGQKILGIFKEFEVSASLDDLTFLKNKKYQEIELIVIDFFNDLPEISFF